MQIHFVTFTGLAPGAEKLSKEYGLKDHIAMRQEKLCNSAVKFGEVDHVHLYNRDQLIKTNYYKNNKKLLDEPIGCGYWAWKPFFILDALSKSNNGDYVIYCDVGKPIENAKEDHGNLITTSLKPLVEWAERHNGMMPGVYLSNHGPAKHWIKRDCYLLMDCDNPQYHNIPTVQAGYTVWKNTPQVVEFLKKWQTLNLDSRLISNEKNTLDKPNYEGFIRNCHDQATLTLLTEQEGVKVFGDVKNQFLGFRNINFIAHEASFQNALKKDKLVLNKVNKKKQILAPYIIRWIELLFQYRRFRSLKITIIQDEINEEIKCAWQTYFPNAEINILGQLNDLKISEKEYDLILALGSNPLNLNQMSLLTAFTALKENGIFVISPILKKSKFELLAKFISNEGKFPEKAISAFSYDLPVPKIPNSRNPIFVTGKGNKKKLETMCLMIKPAESN